MQVLDIEILWTAAVALLAAVHWSTVKQMEPASPFFAEKPVNSYFDDNSGYPPEAG